MRGWNRSGLADQTSLATMLYVYGDSGTIIRSEDRGDTLYYEK